MLLPEKHTHSIPPGVEAKLYLNDQLVGTVRVRGGEHSWCYGEFVPMETFAPFAPLFGGWSLLMHFDDDGERLSRAAAEELRSAEIAIDQLKARLYVPFDDQWHHLGELNIDGNLIEWKDL